MPDAMGIPSPGDGAWVLLCNSGDLLERGLAVPFELVHGGQTCRAFAVRFDGCAVAYLNRCAHVAMEMDWQPNRFFDDSGRWLLCATHGAIYEPSNGHCAGGPCRGGLISVPVVERDGAVFWQAQYPFRPLDF